MNDRDKMIMEKAAPPDARWLSREHPALDYGFISSGCEVHAKNLCEKVLKNKDLFYSWDMWKWFQKEVDLPIIIGFFCKSLRQRNQHLRFLSTNANGTAEQRPAIVWWVGTDVMNFKDTYNFGDNTTVKKLLHRNIIHVADSVNLKKELAEFIPEERIRVVGIPVPVEYEVMPIPPIKKVAVYSPLQRADFYNQKLIIEAAKKLPHIHFIFYSNSDVRDQIRIAPGTENCWFFGKLDQAEIERLIADCCLCIRLTKHDGLPLTVLEFGMAGRQIIFNHPDIIEVQWPFEVPKEIKTMKVANKTIEDLAEVIGKAVAIDKPDYEISARYKKAHGHEAFGKKFDNLLKKAKEIL